LFKKVQPTGFLVVLLGFGLYWVIWIFHLNKQLGSLLVDLDYLKIHKFITYWSLQAVNIKKSSIITGMTN